MGRFGHFYRARAQVFLVSFAVVCVLLSVGPAAAYLGPLPAKPDRPWFTILAVSPISSPDDIEIHSRFAVPMELLGMDAPDDVHIQIRDAQNSALLESARLNVFGRTIENLNSGTLILPPSVRAAFTQLGDGSYYLAIVCDGVRASNVAELLIDAEFDLTNEPMIELVPIEPPPYRELPIMAVRVNGLYRTKIDFSQKWIFADGIYRRPTISVGGGYSDLSPGNRWLRFVEIDGFLSPRIERGTTHEYSISFAGTKPVTIVATPDRPVADAWDAAMLRESENR